MVVEHQTKLIPHEEQVIVFDWNRVGFGRVFASGLDKNSDPFFKMRDVKTGIAYYANLNTYGALTFGTTGDYLWQRSLEEELPHYGAEIAYQRYPDEILKKKRITGHEPVDTWTQIRKYRDFQKKILKSLS